MSFFYNSWDLLKRNRTKVLLSCGAIGGLVLLNRYLNSWQNEWQKSSSRDFVSEVKKKEIHFENTIETCNSTAISLSLNIIKILDNSLSAESILQQIKDNCDSKLNESKIQLWNKLKIRIFTRIISEVYCIVLFVVYLRVQLSILSGYIYVDNCRLNGTQLVSNSNSTNVQNKYLSFLQNFYSEGIQLMIEPIMSSVENAMTSISLKDQIVLQDLKNVFDKVFISSFLLLLLSLF
jgi:hypothetical protein